MGEDKNKQSQMVMGGVSGNKEFTVRRVHKKKPEMEAKDVLADISKKEKETEETKASTETKESTKAKTTKAKTTTKKTTKASEKVEIKEDASVKETKTTKATKKKAEDSDLQASDASKKTTRKSKAKTSDDTDKKVATKESKKDDTKETKTTKKGAKKTENEESEDLDIQKETTAKSQKKEEKESTKEVEVKNEQSKAVADNQPEVVSKKTEAKTTEKATDKTVDKTVDKTANSKATIDKTKISSAVIQMPDKKRMSSYVNKEQNNYRDNKDRNRFSRDNSTGGGRNYSRNDSRDSGNSKGGFGGRNEENDRPISKSSRPQKAKVTESPIDEIKRSRVDFANKSAKDKRHQDNDGRRNDGNFENNERRAKNKNFNSYGNGRVTDYSDDGMDSFYTKKRKKKNVVRETAPVVERKITHIEIPAFITVKEFAEGIEKKSTEVIMELMKLGIMATINQELDFDTACVLAESFGITTTLLAEQKEEDILFDDAEDIEENMQPRPPVVVVMGHVDHGKTSLLDKIRSASVVSGEAGGITQHIGAYTVKLKGRPITFLDTPGHEAFTTMRARGAQVTDIAIIVVAADDGVMPQTVEAIHHAKAAGTEIIIAINKMDKPGANPDKVKQELANHELIPEDWGGSTIMVPISAKKGQGIDELLEMVLLTADVMELKADPKRQAKGTVIEAKLDKSRGPVATVLVQRGTLRHGDSVVCGAMIGNIRAMYDDKHQQIKKAGPSIPVEILGLPEVPCAGDELYMVTDDKMARQLVEKRKIKQREKQLHKSSKMNLETLAQTLAEGNVKDLNILIKADVQGSVEAVTQSLEKLTNEEVRVKVIHGGVGAINESDIVLADVSNAIIIGFNVRPNAIITEKAKEANVDIRLYSVIYSAIEDIEAAMKGMLAPTFEEAVLGHVEIRQTFKVSGVGTIGGAYVLDGKIVRNCEVRVLREDVVIYTGHLASLQRMKDAVKEVAAGYECGLSIENFNDIKIGDVIESYEMREIKR